MKIKLRLAHKVEEMIAACAACPGALGGAAIFPAYPNMK